MYGIVIFCLILFGLFTSAAIYSGILKSKMDRRAAKVQQAVDSFNARQESVFATFGQTHSLIDCAAQSFEFLPDEKTVLSLGGVSSVSQVPSKAYAVKIKRFSFLDDDQIYFWLVPENGAVSYWKVVSISGGALVLEHQIMGRLVFEWSNFCSLEEGQSIKLRQCAQEVDGLYVLTYSFCIC